MSSIATTGGILTDEAMTEIKTNICNVFGCSENDIKELVPLQRGLTNIVLTFIVYDKKYVYRHPGVGSNAMVNRGREALMQRIAGEIGVDTSVIAIDAVEGWRISKFIDGRLLRYHDPDDTKIAMSVLRKIHQTTVTTRWEFDEMKVAKWMKEHVTDADYASFPEIEELKDIILTLVDYTKKDGIKKCYIQGDARDENYLISDDEVYLIDWEFSGYGNPGFNLGLYFTGGDCEPEEVDAVLKEYFQREATPVERRYYFAYIAICAWWSLHWMMFKTASGQRDAEMDAFAQRWKRFAEKYAKIALAMYEEN